MTVCSCSSSCTRMQRATTTEVRATTRRGFRDLWYTVERISGVPLDGVRDFMAQGMLLNVVAAMDLGEVRERWARACSEWPMEAAELDAPDAASRANRAPRWRARQGMPTDFFWGRK